MDSVRVQPVNQPFRRIEVVQRLRAVTEQRLLQQPDDANLLWRLAGFQRQEGDLAGAAATYAAYRTLRPDDERAPVFLNATQGQPDAHDLPADAVRPFPFLWVADFLDADERAALWRMATAAQERFRPVTVDHGGTGPAAEAARATFSMPASAELRALLFPRIQAAIRDLAAVRRLATGPCAEDTDEMCVISYLDGGFYATHHDRTVRRPNRCLTYLYYFHRLPKRYEGGELLLYDQTGKGELPQSGDYTRIVPADNSLILFPSARIHEVLPVRCASADRLDGRLAIAGCFSAPPAAV